MREINEQPATWRDNLLVKYILAEIPIVGGFFKTAKYGHMAQHAVKSSFTLMSGTTVMMLNMMRITEAESPVVKFAKMTGGMAVGMTAGKVLYNTLFFVGEKTVQASKKCCARKEREPLLANNQSPRI